MLVPQTGPPGWTGGRQGFTIMGHGLLRYGVWWHKILMVLHIRNMEAKAFAKHIYEEQKNMQWPGLAKETRDICMKLNIQDCNETILEKSRYLIIVREAINKKNESMLRLLATGKCQRIVAEDYGKKPYISKKKYF